MRAIERMLLSVSLDWHELEGAVGAEPEVVEKIVLKMERVSRPATAGARLGREARFLHRAP